MNCIICGKYMGEYPADISSHTHLCGGMHCNEVKEKNYKQNLMIEKLSNIEKLLKELLAK